MARAHSNGWALVALDVDVDTTTPGGKLVANVMASAAEWERETIGARTKDALEVKRAQGVRLGRPRTLPLEVLERISRDRVQGMTLRAIADALTADEVSRAGFDGDHQATKDRGWQRHGSTRRSFGNGRSS